MIITCPNCNTRYKVAEGEIDEQGRFVRCSSCSHEWLALAPQADAALILGKDSSFSEITATNAESNNALPVTKAINPALANISFYDRAVVRYGLPLAAIMAMLFFMSLVAFRYQSMIIEELPFTETWYEKLDFYKHNDGIKLEDIGTSLNIQQGFY